MSVAHQDSGPEAGSSSDGDLQPGEKVLQDIKEWNGLERRLQEIQQQLESLSWSQELTVSSKRLHSLARKASESSHNPHVAGLRHTAASRCRRMHDKMLRRALSLILSEAVGHKLTCAAETHVFLPFSSFACIAFGNNAVILSFNSQICVKTFSVRGDLTDSISEMSNVSL